jgi:hypothetical protein
MPYPIEKKLVVAIALSALFDLTEYGIGFRWPRHYRRDHDVKGMNS